MESADQSQTEPQGAAEALRPEDEPLDQVLLRMVRSLRNELEARSLEADLESALQMAAELAVQDMTDSADDHVRPAAESSADPLLSEDSAEDSTADHLALGCFDLAELSAELDAADDTDSAETPSETEGAVSMSAAPNNEHSEGQREPEATDSINAPAGPEIAQPAAADAPPASSGAEEQSYQEMEDLLHELRDLGVDTDDQVTTSRVVHTSASRAKAENAQTSPGEADAQPTEDEVPHDGDVNKGDDNGESQKSEADPLAWSAKEDQEDQSSHEREVLEALSEQAGHNSSEATDPMEIRIAGDSRSDTNEFCENGDSNAEASPSNEHESREQTSLAEVVGEASVEQVESEEDAPDDTVHETALHAEDRESEAVGAPVDPATDELGDQASELPEVSAAEENDEESSDTDDEATAQRDPAGETSLEEAQPEDGAPSEVTPEVARNADDGEPNADDTESRNFDTDDTDDTDDQTSELSELAASDDRNEDNNEAVSDADDGAARDNSEADEADADEASTGITSEAASDGETTPTERFEESVTDVSEQPALGTATLAVGEDIAVAAATAAATTALTADATEVGPAESLESQDYALTSESMDRVQDFLGELKSVLVELAQRPREATPVDVAPLAEAIQKGFDRSAEQVTETNAAITTLGRRFESLGDNLEGGVTRTLDSLQDRMATSGPTVPGTQAIVASQKSRQTVVLGVVTMLVLAWSILFWIKTGSPRVALAMLIGANVIACCMLLARRDRS